MPDKSLLLARIENASEAITPLWPLRNFIAANPLAGYEKQPFERAVDSGAALFGGRGLPDRKTGQKALERGLVKKDILKSVLQKHGASELYEDMVNGPVLTMDKKIAQTQMTSPAGPGCLNALMIKYLSAFCDENQAEWEMPGRDKGFYLCWKALAPHDHQLDKRHLVAGLPDDPIEALLEEVRDIPDENREDHFRRHLAALSGWSGYVKWRSRQKTHPWQKAYLISLTQLLAVRLAMARMTGENDFAEQAPPHNSEGLYWLEAWEESYRSPILSSLKNKAGSKGNGTREDKPGRDGEPGKASGSHPARAAFVFCIDVRSEVFRRHLEHCGDYETYGFAGFFGVPIEHKKFGSELAVASCPVLLEPQFKTTDLPACGHEAAARTYLHRHQTDQGLRAVMSRLKRDIAAPFSTVEATGSLFGLGMALRTFIPQSARRLAAGFGKMFNPMPRLVPTIAKSETQQWGLSLSERIFHAEAALKIMGMTENFPEYVFLTGHGGEVVNNPYAAGLDCGACGGNHGGPNARVMAAIFNEPEIRTALKERGIDIPDETLFIPALHNTTTDEVNILDDLERIPGQITKDLGRARIRACEERGRHLPTSSKPETRAGDWAEIRPEWGLARNASFIVGPRDMTKYLDLEGRSFLHSYDWESDPEGKALEIILTAPMVVAQWINSQYYFSTIDNAVYGSGSKTTHNVVGRIGVMQGNASDLMSGLPAQSVMRANGEFYHEPLRLMTIVKAPISRVTHVIAENKILQTLFDNSWVALAVLDPDSGQIMRYGQGKIWHNLSEDPISGVPGSPLKKRVGVPKSRARRKEMSDI